VKSIIALFCVAILCYWPLPLLGDCPGGLALAVAGGASWQKYSSITLYIVSPSGGQSFTTGQQNNISTAFSNWSTTLEAYLSFTISPVTSMPSSPGFQYVQTQFGDTSACGSGKTACTLFYDDSTTGYSTHSIINIDGSMVGSSEILELMAHEAGHTFLLTECAGCDKSKTAMNPDITSSSPTDPQCCDSNLLWWVSAHDYGTSSSCP
jgi:hypothetical protein